MKPLFDLEEIQDAIRDGAIIWHIRRDRTDRLRELSGDKFRTVVDQICLNLSTDDFSQHWSRRGVVWADVYGVMADAAGERAEQEYAWYIKLGMKPGAENDTRRFFLSFHPTDEIRLANGTVLRTTVDDYDPEDDA